MDDLTGPFPARVLEEFVARVLRAGRLRSGAPLTVERDAGAVLVLDAHHGWGHPAALRAMDLCAERAAARGMIGLIASGGNRRASSVAPWGSASGVFGTNPLAVGFPRRGGPPIVVDISTTQTAAGNILLAQKTGQAIPDGWAYDRAGRPTRDPHAAWPEGTLAPLGGHKGYGLSVAVEVFCGVLAATGPADSHGNVVGAIRVDAVLARDEYERGLEELVARIKATPRRPGVAEILLPGEGGARAVGPPPQEA